MRADLLPGRRGRVARVVLATALLVGCTGANGEQPPVDPPEVDEPDEPPAAAEQRCPGGTDATAVWVHEHEPSDLLVDPVDGRAVAGWLQHGVHEGLYRRGADGTWSPQLLAAEGEEERHPDGTLTLRFELRDDVTFSDGTPITPEHVRATYELFAADGGTGGQRLADHGRYDRIDPDSWEIDGQRFAFTLTEPDGAWRTWFARVLPTHVLDDLATAERALSSLSLEGRPVPGSGPFLVVERVDGQRIVLDRNPRYHGPHPDREELINRGAACLAGIELRFVDGTDGVVSALRDGSADLAFATPQDDLVALAGRDLSLSVVGDPQIEVWLLNLADPHLADPRVREALAAAVDRAELVAELHEPLLGDAIPEGGHSSLLFGPDDDVASAAEDGLGMGDTDRAVALLEEAGYDLDGEGTFQHPERGPLVLRLSTTGDDTLRERQQQLLQTRLNATGWDLRIDNRTGLSHLDEQVLAPATLACGAAGEARSEVELPGHGTVSADCDRFDVSQIALSPSQWPTGVAERFRGGSGLDPTGLRSGGFDLALDRCAAALDEGQARSCAERLDRALVTRAADRDGLVAIPLAVRPHLLVAGPRVVRAPASSSAASAGPLVDAVDLVVRRETTTEP